MAENNTVKHRLASLRTLMSGEGVDYVLITSSDYHASEYVGDYFKVSEYFSGCTSDNVILIVSAGWAKLWTDGRYFISAAEELDGTGIDLMKMGEPGVPTVKAFLKQSVREGETLAFDGRCVTSDAGEGYRKIASANGAAVNGEFAPADAIWTDRPAMASHPAWVLDEELAGESCVSKISRVREQMRVKGAAYLIISKLDDIMWLLNIRGADIAYNPVALSYLILGTEEVFLFIQESEVTDALRGYAAKNGIDILPYENIFDTIKTRNFVGNIMVDPSGTSDAMMHLLSGRFGKEHLIFAPNPTAIMKAVKNPVELEHLRKAYLLDSVALCRFIYYVKKNIEKIPMTEVSAAQYLDHLRSELPGYLDLSFGTISAYNANAAMAHYAPTPENCAKLEPHGFLLVDSGGQYLGGTTDVTRTIALGKLTKEMKTDFTTVVISNLRLLYARFLYGVSGISLDIYARAPFWERGQNFNHGTGHGIGYILNVHEGPQVIRWKARDPQDNTAFEPGMITSDEPGIYLEGKYGIRTETITECVEDRTTEFGRFLRFEPLTYAPIDLDAVDLSLMDASDIRKLNDYHRKVWEKISPFIEGDEREWLREATMHQ